LLPYLQVADALGSSGSAEQLVEQQSLTLLSQALPLGLQQRVGTAPGKASQT
jgi:hypothetical protein